ncbi:hypothetical protein HPC49_22985 [Pyxidicoccus fallax]|uniref:Uncharacterized protein n=1 Tax=Pyxidicoccus fallax TaxID=394095 RepID=A0A848LRR1_9BACT|nr:hypothetical protein [Pyxidicoccus fallax]NMO20322.1 hypothetical protein [Pyxidicoccus fallax]NPC81078.1 hypothetical protein [Pyxidicoccus fallax]
MSPLLKNLASICTLTATALLLIADSEPREPCHRAAEDVTFAISESTCGENGLLRIQVGKDSCFTNEVEASPESDLPTSWSADDSGDLREGGWSLMRITRREEQPREGDSAARIEVETTRVCGATSVGGALRLRCRDTEDWYHLSKDGAILMYVGPDDVGECHALLTPR